VFPFAGFAVQLIQVFAEPNEIPIPGVDNVIPGFFSVHLLLIAPVSSIAPKIKIGVDGFLVSIPPGLLVFCALPVILSDIHILIGISPRVYERSSFKIIKGIGVGLGPFSVFSDQSSELLDFSDRLGLFRLIDQRGVLEEA
jgi:hypothetical protein